MIKLGVAGSATPLYVLQLATARECAVWSMMADPLYAKLNIRGKKQFKSVDKATFAENFSEYAKLGLPAHKAALDGNVECLKECFCSCSAEGVPSRDVNGATPLHLAARNNRVDAVKWLIRFTDLTPVVAAKHGETPAHVAAAQGHVESLKQLMTADGKGDIKINLCTVVDNSGFSALHLAIVKHKNECAKLLITELGAKAINALNESGVTAVHLSASAGNVEVLKFLSNKYKKMLTQEDKEGASPVYYAAQEGRLEALKFLCEKCKCSITCACKDGLLPIHAASQCGHTHIVKYIVSCSGNQAIFDTTPDGATPLHFATSSGSTKIAEWLINSDAGGSLVSKKDKNGDTPAHDAAESGDIGMLKLLLESEADLYATNNDGNTPYSIALSGGNMDTANFVMTYASKTPQRDSGGPVRIFNMQGEMDIVELNKSTEESSSPHPPPPPQTSTPHPPSPPQSRNPRRTSIEVLLEKKENKKLEKKKSKKELKAQKSDNKLQKNSKNSKSSSFMDNTAQTLQSLRTSMSSPNTTMGEPDVDLSMTEDELALFSAKQQRSNVQDDSIVVRYSGPEAVNPLLDEEPAEPGYSTINEIVMMEEKKEQKLGRKISKSLKKAIKSGSKVGDEEPKHPKRGFDYNAMGFKPQFRSNPLQKLRGSIPPTPPPTPATGASIAPSDETSPHYLADVEEMDDTGAYNPYSSPDPDIVQMKAEKRHQDERNLLKTSENQKLLKDALQDLSGGESPPEIPKKNFLSENEGKMPLQSLKTASSSKIKPTSQQESSKLEALRVKLRSPVTPRPPPVETNVKTRFPALRSVVRDAGPRETPQTEFPRVQLKRTTDWKRAEFSHETTSGASDELKNLFKKKAVD